MRRHVEVYLLGILAMSLTGPSPVAAAGAKVGSSASPVSVNVHRTNDSFLVTSGDRTLMEYQGAGVPFKPYVKLLTTPSGVNVLRDSPADHKHHHALMFALGVDGVDFWGEAADAGHQEPKPATSVSTLVRDGAPQATIRQELTWSGNKSPLLSEQRSIAWGRTKDRSATLVTWQSKLTPAPGKEAVELTGHHYYGLGMRFLVSMDKGGKFFNSENKEGEIVRGDERLAPVRWTAYTASADGKPVTVAMWPDPANPRHPASMFTMSTPFAYLSATLNLWKEPMKLSRGQTLDLRYGVALWDGAVDPARVEAVYGEWVAAHPAVPSKGAAEK